jgi:hypothetical protein
VGQPIHRFRGAALAVAALLLRQLICLVLCEGMYAFPQNRAARSFSGTRQPVSQSESLRVNRNVYPGFCGHRFTHESALLSYCAPSEFEAIHFFINCGVLRFWRSFQP